MQKKEKEELKKIADKMKDLADASFRDCLAAEEPCSASEYHGAWSAFEECEGMLREHIKEVEEENEEK